MLNAQQGTLDKINIAIDGPAGAGKSTVARQVAKKLSYVYVDTGAMYRAVTWFMMGHGIPAGDTDRVLNAMKELHIELIPGEQTQQVIVNGEDVTSFIRTNEISQHASTYAKIGPLRSILVDMQRQMAAGKGVVMDGRDIGTHVLPQAELKIFLTASVEERALRRYQEIKDSQQITLEQLIHDIAARDRQDEQREVSPLVCAEDAISLDTTSMSIEEVVDQIIDYCRTKTDGAK
ncbi:(d)CMP kinase [Paenibacillus guangzhouensis]|uniref:(d)CMP kinase n=1 Tax=Paenibacillus guangzhouensis TaxID=1473112 RepID=UPI001266983C|nr:(d)CMP kinase [Paenibacillus guangzhouensis]